MAGVRLFLHFVIHDLKSVGAHADRAAKGVVHRRHQENERTEQPGEQRRHEQVHPKPVGDKKPGDDDVQDGPEENHVPHRRRQPGIDVLQTHPAQLDDLVELVVHLRQHDLLVFPLWLETLQRALKTGQALGAAHRKYTTLLLRPGILDGVAHVFAQLGAQAVAPGRRHDADVLIQGGHASRFPGHVRIDIGEIFPGPHGDETQRDAIHGVHAGHEETHHVVMRLGDDPAENESPEEEQTGDSQHHEKNDTAQRENEVGEVVDPVHAHVLRIF